MSNVDPLGLSCEDPHDGQPCNVNVTAPADPVDTTEVSLPDWVAPCSTGSLDSDPMCNAGRGIGGFLGGIGGGGGFKLKNPFTKPVAAAANNGKNVFTCASEFASKYSIAGGLQALGIGTSGVSGFVTNALGGNTFSGITDLITSIAAGSGGGHNVFYNMGQSVVAGPTQGIPGFKGPWGASASGITTETIAAGAYNAVTGAGGTIQTLNGVYSLSSMSMTAGEFASGVGLVKLGYDAVSYFGGAAGCALGVIH